MRPWNRSASLGVFALVVLTSRAALADAIDPAAAEQLFEAGRAAMDHQDYAVACQRFRESQRLDPAAGTLINLAECLDRQGLVASSWQAWKEALDSLRATDERRSVVEARVAAALSRVPKLELGLAEGAPQGAVVARDGVTLGAASLGLALPVDPGAHHVVVTAAGHAPRSYDITLAESESRVLRVEAGPQDASGAPSAPAKASSPSPARPAEPPGGPEGASGSGARTWGWVAVSVGAAGLVVGGTSGILALSRKHTMDDDCTRVSGSLLCGSTGMDAARTGRTFATLANVGVAVGIVGLGIGGYLLLSSSGGHRTAVGLRSIPGGGSAALTHAF